MFIFKKEKEVIDLIAQHVDKVKQCLSIANQTLLVYLDRDLSKAKQLARQTDRTETEADIIRHQIGDKLYYGAYMPLLREDIFKLVESLDQVANAAEKCCDFFLNQRPLIPDDLRDAFQQTITTSLGVAEPLEHAVLCYLRGICPVEVSRQHSREIGLIESKVDHMEWDLTKKIFSSSLDYSHKIHLRLCLDTIVEVSDRAEDSADRLDLVILKSMV